MTDQLFTRRRILAVSGGTIATGLGGVITSTATEDTTPGEDTQETDDHDHANDHELGHPESHVSVAMRTDDAGHHFDPHVVHVKEGGTVTWRLESGVHNTVAYHPDNAQFLPSAANQRIPAGTRPWASHMFSTEGETFEVTFDQAGVYDYTCIVGDHGPRHHFDDAGDEKDWPGHDDGGHGHAGHGHAGHGHGVHGHGGHGHEDSWDSAGSPCHGSDRESWPEDDEGTWGTSWSTTKPESPDEQYRTHEAAGMVGRVVVGWPDLDDEPAMVPPSTELPEAAQSQLKSFNERTRDAIKEQNH